ncbi:GNAT family N-acetyltransferase [Arthrobacter sp. JSM 101049]|uniref:bifunctional acetate--CoA ligase family protein/GNAT family N-acetyltransferase n=1 Tax=Arthrobacter sp. JSM 101049 TaxID=929097 RepID=UPI003564DC4F
MVHEVENAEYPAHWEADVVLRDGSTAHLRPIGPSDAEALQRFHTGQSETSIYLRFFTFKSKLTARELARFTQVDHVNRVAMIVLRGTGIIGVGRYDRLDDPAEAEVAFNIADNTQGKGAGSILLEHLAAAARENGIERFSAEVLPENRKMLTVFAEAGYEVKRKFDDGVVMLEFPIDPTEKSRAVMESREHRAEAQSLAGLLAPRSVAVIGASRRWGSVGYTLLENIIEGGFTGPVYAVNPDALELAGMVSFGSLAEIPEPVDLAVIAVPESELEDVVAACGAHGVRGLLVATGTFLTDQAEALRRQRELVRMARSNGMRLIGPASLGLVNTAPGVSFNASMAPGMPRRGGVGLFSQSAAIGVLLYSAASRRGVGVSSIVSAGNRADVSGNDAMQFWEDDPETSVVALFLESFGNPRKFSRIARRLARSKPVLMAKSDVMGLRLPPGHAVRTTQAPLGAVDAMLRQSGVVRVASNEVLMDVAQLFATQPLPRGKGLAVVASSWALARVVEDNAEQHGLSIVLRERQLELDDGASRALPRLRRTLDGLLANPDVDCLVLALLPVVGISHHELATVLYEAGRRAGKPVLASFTGLMDPGEPASGLLQMPPEPGDAAAAAADEADDGEGGGAAAAGTSANGPAATVTAGGGAGPSPQAAPDPMAPRRQDALPTYASPGAAIEALAEMVRYVAWRERDFGEYIESPGIDRGRAEELLEGYMRRVQGTDLLPLAPAEAADLLGCYGIRVLESVPFSTEDAAVEAAHRIGWPVALKATDQYLRHRLDLGGVRLNITDEQALRANIRHMQQVLRQYGADDLEVQTMAASGQGCVVRALEDPLLGPLVSYGLAGDAVNLLDDWAHAIPPLTDTDLSDFVRSPRASRKLFGYQGFPEVDVAGLEDFLHRVATLKDDHPEVALMEFNPVLVSTRSVTVLAADVRIGNPAQRTDSARRAMR